MNKYISILRGINVSGQKLIKMVELREYLSAAGFNNVTTYIQSGNILFESALKDQLEVSKCIAETIKTKYGFDVPVITLTHTELVDAAARNPYLATGAIEQLHITFLESPAHQERIEGIDADKFLPDEFTIDGKNVYLNVKAGYGKSKLSNNLFESKLKVKATTRNMKTVNKLIELSKQG